MRSVRALIYLAAAVWLSGCSSCLFCLQKYQARCVLSPPLRIHRAKYLPLHVTQHAPWDPSGLYLMEGKDREEDNLDRLKQLMLSSIKWYRREISPLMPPNCRFLPSCSNYALQAIEEFGAIRGGILTAWRIMRCNPTGGYGYDPPQWPPPGYFAGTGGKGRK